MFLLLGAKWSEVQILSPRPRGKPQQSKENGGGQHAVPPPRSFVCSVPFRCHLREEQIQAPCGLRPEARQDVAIDVQGDADRGMSEALLDDLGVHPLKE